jgi:Mrp family chromosome partitioning ATPase
MLPCESFSPLVEIGLPSLSLITAGSRPYTSYALFLSDQFRELLNQVKQQYRFVLIDTPPLLEFPDSAVLASLTDGVVLLVSAGKRGKSDIIEVKRVLDAVKARLFGYVLSK